MQARNLWPQSRDVAGVFQNIVGGRETIFARGLAPHNCRYLRGCQFITHHHARCLNFRGAINDQYPVDPIAAASFYQQRDTHETVGIASGGDLRVGGLTTFIFSNFKF